MHPAKTAVSETIFRGEIKRCTVLSRLLPLSLRAGLTLATGSCYSTPVLTHGVDDSATADINARKAVLLPCAAAAAVWRLPLTDTGKAA
jgi:hypothetical protein